MNSDILPIGTAIELPEGIKLIIVGYEEFANENTIYICGEYPSYLMMDIIPFKKIKEYKEKYKHFNTERTIKHNDYYKVIHEGYKNQKYYDMMNKINDN